MNYEITGEIVKIFDIETFASGFQKRNVVVKTQDASYPQEIQVEFFKDKVDLPDAHKVGDTVTVGFNIHGKRWDSPKGETKFFNTLSAWRITKEGSQATEPAKAKTATPAEAFMDDDLDSQDLPF